MSHYFDCVVDTTDMAKEVRTVNHHVDATTTAVIGMQTAVVDAQKEGASRVCQKVNQGFYSMIHSQISQKMAALQSKIDAHLMRLNQQRKQLASIRNRMERDYQMISARYSKLFNGLNRNLRQRVTELDRPILDFATTDADQVTNRCSQLVGVVSISQGESVKTAQKIGVSNLKYRCSNAIDSIERFINASNRLQMMTDKILLQRKTKEDSDSLLIPVCVMESNYDNSDNTQTHMFVSQIDINESAKQGIENSVMAAQRSQKLSWSGKPEGISSDITNYFRQYVASSQLDERRQRTIIQLFERHPFETLGNK